MSLQQHPLSAAFPAMSAEDFQALTDSIQAIGVQNPVTLFEGMVVDGWHRYRAANDLGMDCPSVDLGDVDPRDFVMAQNKARRHITVAQLAMAANAVYQWRPAGRPAFNSAGPAELKQPEIAKHSGVSVRSLRQADEVAKKAAPAVIEAISRGDVGLEKAVAISKLPQAEQAAAIHKPVPKAQNIPEQQPEAPPEYTELDALRDQISELQAELVVARMGDVSEEEKQHAAQLIAELQAEIKTLQVTVKAANLSRDFLMEENAQMKKQMQMQRREIDKLKAGK